MTIIVRLSLQAEFNFMQLIPINYLMRVKHILILQENENLFDIVLQLKSIGIFQVYILLGPPPLKKLQ